MTLTADSLLSSIQIILQDLKHDIFSRFGYNLDENISFLDLTRNLILLENVFSDDSIRNSQEIKKLAFQLSQRNTEDAFHRSHTKKESQNYEWSLNNNPFNIQNEVEIANEMESDTSQDSIPAFRKEILREYKPSKDEFKKSNRNIRSIVQDNKKNHKTPDLSEKKYGSNSRNSHKIRERSKSNNKDSLKNNRSFDSSIEEYLSKSQREKKENRLNTKMIKRAKHFDEDRRNNLSRPDRNEIKKIILENQPECVDTWQKESKLNHDKSQKVMKSASSGKKNYEKAGRALEDLLKQREKELQRICKIEQRIKEYEEQEETAGRKLRQQSEGEEKVLRNKKTRRQHEDMEYIHEINGQISNLDKEIKQITAYIQECILKEH